MGSIVRASRLGTQAIAGLLTVAFALGALGPALARLDGKAVLGAWFVAGSLAGADLLTERLFRLDCRAVDLGCTSSAATASQPRGNRN